MGFCAQVIESLESLWHKRCGQVMFEVIEAHLHQFVLGEPLRSFKSETSPSSNEVCDLLAFSLLGLNQLQNPNSSLRVAELTKKFLFHGLPADNGGFWEIRIPIKGCCLQ